VAISRRKFLKAGTMVSLSAVISTNSVIDALGQETEPAQKGLFKIPEGNDTDERLTEETFARYVNTQFLIYTSPFTAIKLELIKVSRWEPNSTKAAAKLTVKTPDIDSFSILFRGPRKTELGSKIYKITHDQMGTFDLFISPVGDRKNERLYQAVFNRFRS